MRFTAFLETRLNSDTRGIKRYASWVCVCSGGAMSGLRPPTISYISHIWVALNFQQSGKTYYMRERGYGKKSVQNRVKKVIFTGSKNLALAYVYSSIFLYSV